MMAQLIEREEKSLQELDDKMNWLKNFERLLEIQRNLIWPPITELEPKSFIPDVSLSCETVPFVSNFTVRAYFKNLDLSLSI